MAIPQALPSFATHQPPHAGRRPLVFEGLQAVTWDGLGTVGLGGMAIVAVYLVLTGRLVPRSALDDSQKERDAWRTQAQDAIKELATVTRAVEKQAEAKE